MSLARRRRDWGRMLGGNMFASATTAGLALTGADSAAKPVAMVYGGRGVTYAGAYGAGQAARAVSVAIVKSAQLTNLGVMASGEAQVAASATELAEATTSAAELASGVGTVLVAGKAIFDAAEFAVGYARGCGQ